MSARLVVESLVESLSLVSTNDAIQSASSSRLNSCESQALSSGGNCDALSNTELTALSADFAFALCFVFCCEDDEEDAVEGVAA